MDENTKLVALILLGMCFVIIGYLVIMSYSLLKEKITDTDMYRDSRKIIFPLSLLIIFLLEAGIVGFMYATGITDILLSHIL